jgi:replicative DNA helicase
LKLTEATDRLPPSAHESELAIIGCCLFEPHLARGLHPAWFYNREAQILAGHLRALADNGESFDCVSVVPALRELGVEDPIMLGSQCLEFGIGPSFFKTHAAILSDFARKRRLLEITATGTSDAMSAITDGSDILLGLEKAARAIRDELPEDTEEQGLPEILSTLTLEYETAMQGKGRQMTTTGFRRLDEILGPMLPGQLHVLAARPGCGKTSLALAICDHVALSLQRPVGFVSLEMSRSELVHRLLCARARVDGAALRQGRMDERMMSRLAAANAVLARAPIHIEDRAVTLTKVSGIARRWRMDRGMELLVIDYLGLLRSGERSKSRYEETTILSNAVKRLALDLELPVLCLAQLNRASDTEERPPRLSDLRDSGAIEQDADTVLLLEPAEGDSVHVMVSKNRSGRVGRATLQFEKQFTRFYEA